MQTKVDRTKDNRTFSNTQTNLIDMYLHTRKIQQPLETYLRAGKLSILKRQVFQC